MVHLCRLILAALAVAVLAPLSASAAVPKTVRWYANYGGMAHVLRLGIALALFALSLTAQAVILAKDVLYWDANYNGVHFRGETAAEACTAAGVAFNDPFTGMSGPYCHYTRAGNGYVDQRSEQVCPDNSSLSNGTCLCNMGTLETTDGFCREPGNAGGTAHQQECYAFSGVQTVSGGVLVSDIALTGSVADGTNLCYPTGTGSQGCTVTFSNTATASYSDGTKVSYGTYSMTNTGKSYGSNNLPDYTCTAGAENTPTENKTSDGTKCIGYVGTVNGVESCIKGTSSATGVDITGGTSTTTNSDGSKTETKNDTSCSGAKCTTTTTTTNTSSAGTTSTSTTSSTQTQAAYCSGSGAGTAACTGSGSGTGSSACEKNPSAAGCGGTAAGIGELYQKKSRTVADVLGDAKSTMEGAPITSAMAGFLSVQAGGSCPMWVWQVPYFNVTIAVDAFCSTWAMQAYGWVATAVLLVASFLAFRIAVE